MITAVVRAPTLALARAIRTFVERTRIDVERAVSQHRAYVRALEEAGARVVELPAEPPSGEDAAPKLPDAPFVEDTAVLLDGLAVLARPAEPLRRREVPSVERALAEAGLLGGAEGDPARIRTPGLLEGGDVLRIGRRLFVGLSGRTNEEGLRQLAAFAESHGYRVTAVPVSGALHLKTAVTHVPGQLAGTGAGGLLLANPDWLDLRPFRELDPAPEILPVPPEEPFGANTLTIGQTLLVSAAFPRTRRLLARRGFRPVTVDVSELEKAEAGLTCLSLRTAGPSPAGRGHSSRRVAMRAANSSRSPSSC